MKWSKIIQPILFLLLSVGLVLGLAQWWAAKGPTAEERAIGESALEQLIPHYTQYYETMAWRSAARGENYAVRQVSYEVWQSRARLGRKFTYVKNERTGGWARWCCEDGLWTNVEGGEPSPFSNPVRLLRFTVDVPPVQVERARADEAVAREMGLVLEPFIQQEYSRWADATLMVLVNTEELYAMVALETRSWAVANNYFLPGQGLRVQMERTDDGQLAVASWMEYWKAGSERNFYEALAACDGAAIFIAPEERENNAKLKAFLQGEGHIVDAQSGASYSVDRVNELLGVEQAEVVSFALADLDIFGTPEAVLRLRVNNKDSKTTLVLHREDDGLVAYVQNWQGLLNLKEDGSFFFYYGEETHGYGRLDFADGQAVLSKITWEAHGTDSEGEPMFAYYVDGPYRPQNYGQFSDAMEWQAEKAAAVWHDITADTLERVLAGTPQLEKIWVNTE